MNEHDLRALIREVVEKRLGRPAGSPAEVQAPNSHALTVHPSHHVYVTVVNAGDACVIEPAVSCDHCGYCKSHGH